MIAKLFGGPMDGAGYAIVTDQKAPDGLWFNGKDEHGRNVQNQYVNNGPIEHVSGNAVGYVYDGQVIDTGIEFATEPSA